MLPGYWLLCTTWYPIKRNKEVTITGLGRAGKSTHTRGRYIILKCLDTDFGPWGADTHLQVPTSALEPGDLYGLVEQSKHQHTKTGKRRLPPKPSVNIKLSRRKRQLVQIAAAQNAKISYEKKMDF